MTFDWNEYTKGGGEHDWMPYCTIFLTLHGSHSYGTNTPESDLDIRGVVVPPKRYSTGILHEFEQEVLKVPDLVIFNIRKFIHLSSGCNPNALEILFTDPEQHLFVNSIGKALIEKRHMFLSRMARETFQGYAQDQMNRINLHRRWLLNPPTHEPTRGEFGLAPIPVHPAKNQIDAAMAMVKKKVDSWNWHKLEYIAPSMRQAIREEFQRRLVEVTSWSELEMDDKVWTAAANSLGLTTNFIEVLTQEKRYAAKISDWKKYLKWKKDRNPERAKLEARSGYDCYSADTEFLTSSGWKLFDEVNPSDELATVFIRRGCTTESMSHRTLLGVEYQKPTHRFDASYNGPMYSITGHHTDVLVTANHRMLTRKVERRSGKEFEWTLEEAAYLPDTFDTVIAPTPRTKAYSSKSYFGFIPISSKAYLTLMGWYLSDGCAVLRSSGSSISTKGVKISQDVGGKLSAAMTRWQTDHGKRAKSSLYKYRREPNIYNPKKHFEVVLDVRGSVIASKLIKDCGVKKMKRIPRWVFGLSKTLMESLLFAMILGDGTLRKHKTKEDSFTYYSTIKSLADDVQELALLCGWETALWGPYDRVNPLDNNTYQLYQVHLRKEVSQFRRLVRSANVSVSNVIGQRVVCFTVPNGTLITRRNGKIGIHGNCKHAMHLVRLSRSCKDLLITGDLVVYRDDAEELLAIRNGAWKFEDLVTWFKVQTEELNKLEKISPLPPEPELYAIDQLCQELVERSWSSYH